MATAIRVGETAPQVTVAQLKDEATRVYHHMVPGARFVLPDGLEVRFMGGVFTTQDPEIISELDKVVDKHASMIYTKKTVAESVAKDVAAVAADAVQNTKSPE